MQNHVFCCEQEACDWGRICTVLLTNLFKPPQWIMWDRKKRGDVRATSSSWWTCLWWHHHDRVWLICLIRHEQHWCLESDLFYAVSLPLVFDLQQRASTRLLQRCLAHLPSDASPQALFGSLPPSAWCPPWSNPPTCQSSRTAGGGSWWKYAFLACGWSFPLWSEDPTIWTWQWPVCTHTCKDNLSSAHSSIQGRGVLCPSWRSGKG